MVNIRKMTNLAYTTSELMTINAARLLRNGDRVLVGVGLPNLACNLAQRTHAPDLLLIYEAGVIGSRPKRLPLSIGDPTLVSGATGVCSMYDIFTLYLQRGFIDVGFLGGAQIDRFGNINATVIGDYNHPKVRLPGSGGSMEIAAWADRCYIITPHQIRRFPAHLDFCTSAGNLDGYSSRVATGVRGSGPQAIVTDLGILQPDANGELILTALHPGASVEQAKANTGWPLRVSPALKWTDPPDPKELHILRVELDPQEIYL
jgi:glutaconate CoA-transferase subunit B